MGIEFRQGYEEPIRNAIQIIIELAKGHCISFIHGDERASVLIKNSDYQIDFMPKFDSDANFSVLVLRTLPIGIVDILNVLPRSEWCRSSFLSSDLIKAHKKEVISKVYEIFESAAKEYGYYVAEPNRFDFVKRKTRETESKLGEVCLKCWDDK